MNIGPWNNRGSQNLQIEARANLSAIYSAQRAFQVENGRFSGDLAEIGYVPSGTMRYVVGLNPKCNPGAKSTSLDFAEVTLDDRTKIHLDEVRVRLESLPCPDKTQFVALAAARLNGDQLDVWTINEKKLLQNTESHPEKPRFSESQVAILYGLIFISAMGLYLLVPGSFGIVARVVLPPLMFVAGLPLFFVLTLGFAVLMDIKSKFFP